MVTSYNNSICKQAEIYYYDFLYNENTEQIPKNLIQHIGKCLNCREKINQLKNGLLSQKSIKFGERQVIIAVTDLLNLHLAYIGDKVVCSTVRPFLPIVLDPSLGIRIPTPITVHLDHCQQCAQDLKTIKSLNLTGIQSCRFSQLLADKAAEDTISCRQAQAVIPAVSSMVYKDTSEQILKHLCTCEQCRQDLYEYRETARIEGQYENEAQKCSTCDQLTMSDIFDYVIPYGIDPTREDTMSRNSIAVHLRSCSVCLAKIQTLHNIVYGIIERAESKVATIYHINDFSEIQEPSGSDDLYAGYPISVEIKNIEDIENERPAPPIRSIAAVRQKTPMLNTSHLLRSGIIAVAGVMIVVALFFRGSVAGAVTINQIYSALEKAKNVYISTYVPEKASPTQERWISRTLNLFIMKTGDELTLMDLKNNQRSIKNLDNNSINITELPEDYVADAKQSMSGFLGIIPFYNISDLPDNAEWNRVPDNELEIPLNNTEVYDLTWIDKTNAALPVFLKWRFIVDSQTYLPLNIRCYGKSGVDGQYILNTTKTVEYLDDSAIQVVIELF